ncbi:NAD(P)H-binding protein [Actinophytocola sp.]|uniref:NAD(P)H-binding protein n=1 Tax=Actinophytocola sp. TaxID=1872138 RepID=UPI002ED38B69
MPGTMIVVMILITGATGTIGGEVVRLLSEAGVAMLAMTRDPRRIDADVPVVRGDFESPPSLTGVDTLFLIALPGHGLAVLDAARAAGVGKVVLVSGIGTGERVGDAVVGPWFWRAEQAVQASGMDWTILRPTNFASNSLRWLGEIAEGQPIPDSSNGVPDGVVDPRDVAAVAATVLRSDHNGQTYTLTGPELLTMADQAEVLARVLDRPVWTEKKTVAETRELAEAAFLAHGLDVSLVEDYLTAVKWGHTGGGAIVSDDVPRILGRPATSFETWVRDNAAAFSSGPGARSRS